MVRTQKVSDNMLLYVHMSIPVPDQPSATSLKAYRASKESNIAFSPFFFPQTFLQRFLPLFFFLFA